MTTLRRLQDGTWNRPPLITAARAVFAQELGNQYELVSLGEMASFLNGTSYHTGYVGDGPNPIIRISNISDPSADYLRTAEEFSPRFMIAPGDLLVSWSASFKTILWPGPPGVLNQHIFKVTERDGNDRSYVRHAIEAAFDEMRRKVVGIGMMHLRRADFLGHKVPCPPADTQAAVGRYLDWVEQGCSGDEPKLGQEVAQQGAVVVRLRDALNRIEQAARLRKDAARERTALVGRAAATAFADNPTERLGDYATVQSGYAFRSDWFSHDGIRLARNANVGHGKLDWSDEARIPLDRRSEFARFELVEGDILVSLDRPIISSGVKVARVRHDDLPCLLLQRVGRVILRDASLDPEYLFRWLQSPRFVLSIDPGRSNGVPHISQKQIEAIPFAAPTLEEQRRVVRHLDTLDAYFRQLGDVQVRTSDELDALALSMIDRTVRP